MKAPKSNGIYTCRCGITKLEFKAIWFNGKWYNFEGEVIIFGIRDVETDKILTRKPYPIPKGFSPSANPS
jgi:hypothetical protein